ncbi:MAG: helix-turn-helix transcriptional regulator [Desulfobacteraceae bacterium]|nr:helix-turn-helix transcriptional regulator [Desulfobacteraceae bacterium]
MHLYELPLPKGENITAYRIDIGWTQKKLAVAIGVHEQQIQRYERTKYQGVSLKRLTEIINTLNDAKAKVKSNDRS